MHIDLTHPTLTAGDVIEFSHHGEPTTAEVMLVTDDGIVLLDLFDGDRPVHTRTDALLDVRVFEGELVAA